MEKLSLKNLPRGAGLAGALIALIAAASFISPHFLNPVNLLNVLRHSRHRHDLCDPDQGH
jgi:predicted ABC-type sugar transport system permease subunit